MTYITILKSGAEQRPQQGREYTTLETERENNSPQQGRQYKSLKTERQNDQQPYSNDDDDNSRQTNQVSVRFLLYLTLAYTVTVAPDYTLNLICIHHQELELDHSVFEWTGLTFFLYTLYHTINPLLTCYFNSDFRFVIGKRRLGQKQYVENVVTANNEVEETLA